MTNGLLPKEARQYLRSELDLRQRRNPGYSLRAFARDLNLGPSTLCEVLAGRLGLSRGRAEQVSSMLNLDSENKTHFLDLLEAEFGRKVEDSKAARWRIQKRMQDQPAHLALGSFAVISEWYHFPILELIELDEKFQQPKAIAKALGLKLKVVQEALARMQRLDLLRREGNKLIVTDTMTFTGDEVPSQAIRQAHSQMLDLAQKALVDCKMDDRDNLSIFISVPKDKIAEFQQELRTALTSVANKYAALPSKDSIAAVTYHTFPIYEGPAVKS